MEGCTPRAIPGSDKISHLSGLEPFDIRPEVGFVMVGEPSAARVVILHRSRRQHFSPVRFDGGGACAPSALPAATRALWPKL